MNTPSDRVLGIDIGGTFTDLVALDPVRGDYLVAKTPTVASRPELGVARGLRDLLGRIGGGEAVTRVIHATTLFSNALIERKGAKTGLITTGGFRDVLELGRERKYDIYDLFLHFPEPLVPRDLRLEVGERIAADGTILVELDEDGVREAASRLVAAGVQSLAIACVNSHVNPEHEHRAAELVREACPGVRVTVSSDVATRPGEFERFQTAVINACIKPLAEDYIEGLTGVLRDEGITAPLMLMLSSGGLTTAGVACHMPVRLLESGPAAGAMCAARTGTALDETRLVAFDMGGTTAKIAIVDDGMPEVAHEFEVARERRFVPGSGLPVEITTVELLEIGAGGGSIARRDALGLLKVGPDSAGAEPGPACYGRGATRATVTDADLVLGSLNADGFASDLIELDPQAAAGAMAATGEELGLGVAGTALGIQDVVRETMARAAQVHLARKGRDPRDYTLFATGGAAPAHACAVAARLGISRVIIPPAAGVASALGLAVAPVRVDGAASVGTGVASVDPAALARIYEALEDSAKQTVSALAARGVPECRRLAELRYRGQGTVLVVDITRALGSDDPHAAITTAFHEAHERDYGRCLETVAVEFMTARSVVRAAVISPDVVPQLSDVRVHAPAGRRERRVQFPGWTEPRAVPVLERGGLGTDAVAEGPAVIEEGQTTTVLPERSRLRVDDMGNLVIDLDPAHASRSRHVDMGDPVHLEILWNRLIAAVDEAAASLVRASFSTVVRESYDFSCIVTDIEGRALAQASDSIPSFIGTLPDTVKHMIRKFPPDMLGSGDVLVTNDPHMGTGHLPDISVCRPVCGPSGRIVGFAASTAHAPDIGGKIRSPEPREVYEEGLQIPILKLHERGRPDETLLALLRQNVRVPDQVEGDLDAQLGALAVMERRVCEILDTYGLSDLQGLSRAVRSRSERALRDAIGALPDGAYRASVSTDGLADRPVTLRARVEVAGERLAVDFSGSSGQVDRAINCPFCYTRAMSAYAVKSSLASELPNNDGVLVPLAFAAPEGSIVNPRHPAAVGSRVLTGHYIPALVMEALWGIVPDRVLAGAGSPIWCVNINGTHADGTRVAGLFFFNGGMGASARGDGLSCVSWPSNISATSSEEIEHRLPVRILRRELRDGSGGPGLHTGGRGQLVELRYTGAMPGVVAFLAERTDAPARGLAGGGDGGTGRVEINGVPVDPKAQQGVEPGDVVLLATPGGGGYGAPPRS